MKRGYALQEHETNILIPIMEGIIWKLETGTVDDIELSVINLGPNQFIELLKLLGYEQSKDWDENGWEQDTWYHFSKEGHLPLTLFYSGHYGDISLSLDKDED